MITFKFSQPYRDQILLDWKGASDYPRYTISSKSLDLQVKLEYLPNQYEEYIIPNVFNTLTLKEMNVLDDGRVVLDGQIVATLSRSVPDTNVQLALGGDLSGRAWTGPIGDFRISGIHAGANVVFQLDNLIDLAPIYVTLGNYFRKPFAQIIRGPKDNLINHGNFNLAYNYPWYWEVVKTPTQLQFRLYKITDTSDNHLTFGTINYTPKRTLILVKAFPLDYNLQQVSAAFSYDGIIYVAFLSDGKVTIINSTGEYVLIYRNNYVLPQVKSMYFIDTSLIYEDLTGITFLFTLSEDLKLRTYDISIPRVSPTSEIDLSTDFAPNTLYPADWYIDQIVPKASQEIELALWSRDYNFTYLSFYVSAAAQIYWLSDDATENFFWTGDNLPDEYEIYWQR